MAPRVYSYPHIDTIHDRTYNCLLLQFSCYYESSKNVIELSTLRHSMQTSTKRDSIAKPSLHNFSILLVGIRFKM
jgi:hypothetical protein